MRAVVGSPATLTLYVTDATGTLVDATGTPTLAVTAGDGTAVGSPTVSHGPTGTYTATLGSQAAPDQLTAAWGWTLASQAYTANQRLNLVGQRLVDLRTLKTDPALAAYTPAQLNPVMDAVEDAFDAVLGFPCVPRGERVDFWLTRPGTLDTYPTVTGLPYGAGAPRLLVPGVKYPISLVDAKRYFQTLTDLALIESNGRGAFEYADGRPFPPGPYRVWVVHGFNPPPGDLRWAAATLIRYQARKDSKLPERAASVSTEGSTIVISLPTPERPTGIASVDAVLNRYRAGGGGSGIVI